MASVALAKELIECDLCHCKATVITDGPTLTGQWANMCPTCTIRHGGRNISIGTRWLWNEDEGKYHKDTLLRG